MPTMRLSLLLAALTYGSDAQRVPCDKIEQAKLIREHDCVALVYAEGDLTGDCALLTLGKSTKGELEQSIGSFTLVGTCALTMAIENGQADSTSTFFAGSHDASHHPIMKALGEDDPIMISEMKAGTRGLEITVTSGLFCSALLLPTVFLLCSHEKTALWSWPILDSVISGLLCMLWYSIYKSQWDKAVYNGSHPYGWVELLVRYVAIFLAACIFFMKLEIYNRDWLHNATTLINPLLQAFAGDTAMSFLFSWQPKTIEDAAFACVYLYAGQAVFMAVMHFVMTHIGGSTRDPDTEAHLPGEHIADTDEKPLVGEWQTSAESVLWGSLGGAVATSLTGFVHFALVQPGKFTKPDDKRAWMGEHDLRFWGSALVLLTFLGPLLKVLLADVSGKGFTGRFKVLATSIPGKVSGLCLINLIRIVALVHVFPGQRPVFSQLIVAFFASALVACMGGAMAPEAIHDLLSSDVRHFVRANVLNEAAAAAGKGWGKVYGASVESGILQNTFERLSFAIVMSTVVGGVYWSFIKPQVKRVMKEHQKKEKKKAKVAEAKKEQ